MDTIVVILFLLLPTIFGLIGKKFEAAGQEGEDEGQQPQAEPYDPMKKLAEMLGLDDPTKSSTEANEDRFPMPDVLSDEDEETDVAPDYSNVPEYQEQVHPEPVYQESVVVETPRPVAVTEVQMRARLAAMKTQTVMQEEEKKKQKMVVDPKKLVIYSEIMKPKYLE